MGADARRLHYIPYGVDTTQFAGAEPGHAPPVFLAVGRFVEKKAPETTLLAFMKVRQSVPDARLVFIGDGPLLSVCRRISRALGLDCAVTFRGYEPPATIARVLATARAFVQHSVTASDGDAEGTPVSILEAMAAGLPVVSTRHGGIKDVVVEGETGFLVDEGDVEGMAERMAALAADAALAARLGAAGRRRALDLFTIETSIARLWEVVRTASARRA